MAPQAAHVHLTLLIDAVEPGLHCHIVIHRVPDPAYFLQAPVLGQGAHSVPAAQVHHSQALGMSHVVAVTLNPKLAHKHLQKAAAPVGQNTLAPHHLMQSWCRKMKKKILLQVKKRQITWKMRRPNHKA